VGLRESPHPPGFIIFILFADCEIIISIILETVIGKITTYFSNKSVLMGLKGGDKLTYV